jgi:hypothetical protein
MALFSGRRRKHAHDHPDVPVVMPPAAPPTTADLAARLDNLLELESMRVREHQQRLAGWQVDAVLDALAEMHDPVASAALARAVRSLVGADAPFTSAAFDAAVRDGSDVTVDALVDVAVTRWEDLARLATRVLVDAKPPSALRFARARLSDSDGEVRARAVSLVAELDGAAAVDAVLPMLADDAAKVRRQAAESLGDLGDRRALVPLLVEEERERRTTRAGTSAVTWTGRMSPYLVAAARIATGDPTIGWTLARELPYDAEQRLQELLGPVIAESAAQVAAAVTDVDVRRVEIWQATALEDLLAVGAVSRHDSRGPELRYFDAKDFVTDCERCRRLGLRVTEAAGESTTTVYGEREDWVASVTCVDGTLRLVTDREDLRRLRG